MKIKCLVVDDEPLARRILEKHISSIPSLELVKQCSNAMEAAAYLHTKTVDIMFLDIKMPELTGLELLKTLPNPPHVIITTAYSEFALEGYEYSITDYLLKPISFKRFLKAVNKIIPKKREAGIPVGNAASEIKDDFIFLRADKIDHKVSFSTIKFLEGCGNFVKVFTDKKLLVVAETMTTMEKNLPSDWFLRTHKSYIVSIQKIEKVEGNIIRVGEKTIPIGKQYRMNVRQVLRHFHLRS
jgi:DNA-binding LytR/AlgR family response regulator